MRTIWSLLSIMLGILAALTAKALPTSNSLVITHATIIDVRNGHLLRDQTIVITGDRITSISHQPIDIPARAEVVNAAGKFIIPGLWDLHAHALWSTDQITRMFDLFLANGITGIRDMGSPLPLTETLGWREKVANGSILGPRIYAAGKLVDGPTPVWPGSVAVETAEQAREALLHKDGVDFIKVYSRLPREPYFALADEAKKEGIPYVGHVPIYVSASEASSAGQRSIEHLSEILFVCSSKESDLRKQLTATAIGTERDQVRKQQLKVIVNTFDERKARQLSRLFAKNDTWQVPTLLIQYTYAFVDRYELHDSPGVGYVPPSAVNSWIERLNAFRRSRDDTDMEAQKRSYELELHVVRN
jgi:hypothetical protein